MTIGIKVIIANTLLRLLLHILIKCSAVVPFSLGHWNSFSHCFMFSPFCVSYPWSWLWQTLWNWWSGPCRFVWRPPALADCPHTSVQPPHTAPGTGSAPGCRLHHWSVHKTQGFLSILLRLGMAFNPRFRPNIRVLPPHSVCPRSGGQAETQSSTEPFLGFL